MENNTKYNGWTNHATWRINLEILGDIEFEEQVSADYLKDMVEEIVFGDSDINTLQSGYAQAFISEVNFYEIANNINEDLYPNGFECEFCGQEIYKEDAIFCETTCPDCLEGI